MGTAMATGTDMKSKHGAWVVVMFSALSAQAEVKVDPRVTVSETFTDNVSLSSAGQRSEQITDISPGIQVNVTGGRLKTYFDYALNQVMYAQGSAANRQLNALTTYGSFEALDNWAFVDFSGSISQQAISAFGTQAIDNTSLNANRAEVSTYRVSPYLKGRIGSAAEYEARYSRTVSGNDAAGGSSSAATNASVRLSGGSAFRRLGWTSDASRQNVSYSKGRATEADRFNLGLSYELTPQFSLTGSLGLESNDYTSLSKQSTGTRGLGAVWRPSERTSMLGRVEKRSFGNAHQFTVDHRTARTSWQFSDSRDVASTAGQINTLGDVSTPVSSVVSGFLSSALSLQRSQSLSFSLIGVRTTVTLAATRSETNRLDTVSLAQDDLTTSSQVAQRGFSVNVSHRLTPDYTLRAQAGQQHTTGSTSSAASRLRSLSLSVSGQLGQKTSASVGARHVVSDGGLVPYTENALTGQLNVQF